jgi:hypothetical protein
MSLKTSLFTVMKYELLNYTNLNPEPQYTCKGCDPYQKPDYLNNQFLDYQNLSFGYFPGNFLKFSLGLSRSSDRISSMNQNIDTIRKDVVQIDNIGQVTHKFLGISPSCSLVLKNNSKGTSSTNIEMGGIIDFIYKEKYFFSIIRTDSIIYSYPIQHVELNEKTRDQEINEMKFNKVSPFIALSFEKHIRNTGLSFSIGSCVIFRPLFQKANTEVAFKRYKMTPLLIGLSYRL